MARATRTVNPLHFEDLEPHRFEDLVRQLAHGFRPWLRLEATGRLGQDQGVDIAAEELVTGEPQPPEDEADEDFTPVPQTRAWRFQCKRYKRLGAKDVRLYADEAVKDLQEPPYGLVLAAACDVTGATLEAFHSEVRQLGVVEGHLWTKAHLEDLLFRPDNDHLLFAYFGISLTAKRRSRLQTVRSALTIKRKLMRTLQISDVTSMTWVSVLVRDLADESYPGGGLARRAAGLVVQPWEEVKAVTLESEGLIVSRNSVECWVEPDGSWDMIDGSETPWRDLPRADRDWRCSRLSFSQTPASGDLWLIPWENILEVDALGDRYFEMPHIYCLYGANRGPCLGRSVIPVSLSWDLQGPVLLSPDDRKPLFDSLTEDSPIHPEKDRATMVEDSPELA